MSAVCIPINQASAARISASTLKTSGMSGDRLFTIIYLNPETKKQEEKLEKSFPSRYEAFTWAWDFSNGRVFTVRPSNRVTA